jgi:hypothetical protein
MIAPERDLFEGTIDAWLDHLIRINGRLWIRGNGSGKTVPKSMWITIIVFTSLFLVGLLTRAAGGRAR